MQSLSCQYSDSVRARDICHTVRSDGCVITDFLGVALVLAVSLVVWFVLHVADFVEYELSPRYRRRLRAAVNAIRIPPRR